MKTFIGLIALAVTLSGCGGGDGGAAPRPTYTTSIQSDPAYDGDIAQTTPTAFTVTQGMSVGVQSVFTGIDPVGFAEYRSFLDFPLAGSGGVPGNAIISSASLDVYINSINPTVGTIPLLIELVTFQPPNLLYTDFDRTLLQPLASLSVTGAFSQADVGTNVAIDVTPLMAEAQRLNLQDFQVRILEDLGSTNATLLEINDSTGSDRAARAPLLTITYF